MENKLGIHCFVSGRVQGVFYRASTQKKAGSLGVTGWVRNLPDGRVEVWAHGERGAVMALYEWLKKGPELAKVESVSFEEVAWQNGERFETRP